MSRNSSRLTKANGRIKRQSNEQNLQDKDEEQDLIFQQPILLLCSSGLCSFHIQKASRLENRQTQKDRAEWVSTHKGIQPENPQNWAKFYETKTTQKRFSMRNANVVLHSAAKLTSDSNREMECQGGGALVRLLFYSLSLSLSTSSSLIGLSFSLRVER